MPRAGQLLHPPPTPPPSDLAKQLVFDESQAVRKGLNEHGTLFNQIINVTGANGRTIPITTGWIIGPDGVPRLTTAFPKR